MESLNTSTYPSAGEQKILVVDDHATVRNSLVALINSAGPSMRCVGAAVSVADGLQLALQTQPDCVLLDADLAGEDGMALIPLLLERISCTVVVISSHADDSLGAYAIRLGAVAFIHKLAPAAELLNALATIPPKRLPITSLELH